MKFTVILVFGLLLTGCGRNDRKLEQQVAGTWSREGSGTMTIARDGSFSITSPKLDQTNWFVGTWQIGDGVFTMMVTNASAVGSPLIGGVERYRILHVDDHQFVYEESGKTNTLKR